MAPDLPEPDRRRAADQLGVPPDAPPADARAAFLRRLPAAGFCPAPPLCAAAASLAGQPVPGAVGVLADPDDDDTGLYAEVAAFEREFWSLRPDVRRPRWQDLFDRAAADPRLAARLRRLEAGVDLRDAAGVPGPPRQREVVGMIQALFVLGPIDRAARRRELLDALPPPAAGWEQAARRLQADLPAHATLEPALVERLSTWTRRLAAPAAAAGRPAPTWGFQVQDGVQMPQAPQVVARPPARRSPSWAAFLWIGLVLTAVKAFTGGFQEANPRPDPALRSPLSRPDRPLYIDPLPPTPAYRPLPPGAERIFRKEAEPKPAPDRGPP